MTNELASIALEVPINLLKNFAKVFEKINNDMELLLRLRELEKLSILIDQNKDGICILKSVIQDLDHIADYL